MALILDLKPGEKVIIGQTLITNDRQRTRLSIEGNAPILRERDILRPEDVKTPCQQLYLMVQLMYLDKKPEKMHADYFQLVRDIQEAAPSTIPFLLAINERIIDGSYYRALREAKRLIAYEARLLANV